jgi:hypothetical protein
MIFGPMMMIIWLVFVIVIAVAVIRWLQAGTIGPLPSLSWYRPALVSVISLQNNRPRSRNFQLTPGNCTDKGVTEPILK